MTNGQPIVSIIAVTINTPQLTQACLESVIRNTTVPYELIVVNNSRARKIQHCLKRFKGIRLIQNVRNLGYAKAANQGAFASRGEFLCFLNSDTLVPPRWMERLLDAIRKPGVGAVCPEGTRAARRYIWPPPGLSPSEATTSLADQAFQQWYRGREEVISWLTGFCLAIPRAVIARVGLFDDRLFFGHDDCDYSLRLRLFGYRLLRVKSLFIHHQKSGSIGPEKRRRLDKEAEWQFMAKWQSLLGKTLVDHQAILDEINRRVRQQTHCINSKGYLEEFYHAHRHLLLPQ